MGEVIKIVLKKDKWENVQDKYKQIPFGITTIFKKYQKVEDEKLKDAMYTLDIDTEGLSEEDKAKIDFDMWDKTRCIVEDRYLEFWCIQEFDFDLPIILLKQEVNEEIKEEED